MKKYFKRISIGAVLGGILGFAYYHFIGCDGGCPITGNPFISTAYGILAGVLVMFPSRIKNEKDTDQQTN